MKPTATAAHRPAETSPRRRTRGRVLRWPGLVGLAVLMFIISSCSVLQHETEAGKSMLQTITGTAGKSNPSNTVEILEAAVMRQADSFVGAVAQATDELRVKVPTTEARNMGQQWKLIEATAAYINATGENPVVNAVDMVVLATLSRYVVEDYWVGEKFGEAARPLLQAHQRLESNAWSIVQLALTPAQQEEIRNLLREYHEKFPHTRYVAAVRLPELAGTLGRVPNEQQMKKTGSLFSLLYLNPLAGLDPTTEAIQQTRNLAQRAMYYAQRAPMLLSWQVELTTYQLAVQPEAKRVLSDVNDVAQSTKVFAQTAEGLPKLVNDQREAAISQLLAGVPLAGSNLIVSLASEEKKVRDLLVETRQTLNSGSQMATSLNAAIQSLDAFVHYVSPPETNAPPPSTNSPPFNVLDYGTAASQIAVAAEKLNTLLASANQSLPQVNQMSQQASMDAKEVVNHAFRLGLVLIMMLGIVSVLVVLACRRLGKRAASHEHDS